MTDDFASPLLDADGKVRMRRFAIATISSAIIITLGVGFAMYAADPSGGWAVAFGIGAMIGFWMCPLAGAVIGNGYHEIQQDRARRVDGSASHEADSDTESDTMAHSTAA